MIIRVIFITRPLGIHNENASAHVLVTLKSLKQHSASDSKLLPIYNFSGKQNKNINNMPPSSIKGKDNHLYTYVSFPVLGFLLPYRRRRGCEHDIYIRIRGPFFRFG